MREICTSGLMSGDGKRGGAPASVLAPILDSTIDSVHRDGGPSVEDILSPIWFSYKLIQASGQDFLPLLDKR